MMRGHPIVYVLVGIAIYWVYIHKMQGVPASAAKPA